jgi:hypothetical protein
MCRWRIAHQVARLVIAGKHKDLRGFSAWSQGQRRIAVKAMFGKG